jgi:hypothetical protein
LGSERDPIRPTRGDLTDKTLGFGSRTISVLPRLLALRPRLTTGVLLSGELAEEVQLYPLIKQPRGQSLART